MLSLHHRRFRKLGEVEVDAAERRAASSLPLGSIHHQRVRGLGGVHSVGYGLGVKLCDGRERRTRGRAPCTVEPRAARTVDWTVLLLFQGDVLAVRLTSQGALLL